MIDLQRKALRTSATLRLFRTLYPIFICLELLYEWPSIQRRLGGALCHPIGSFQMLGLPPLGPSGGLATLVGLLASLLLLSIGLQARVFAILASLLFFWLIGSSLSCAYGTNPDYMNWQHAIVFFNLGLLSLPHWNSKRDSDGVLEHQNQTDVTVTFLLKFNLIFSYFAGGVAKARWGLDWVNGTTLQGYLIFTHLHLDRPFLLELASHFYLLQAVSWVVLLAELMSPLALWSQRFSVLFVAGTLFMQAICFWLMDLRWMHYFGWAYLIYFCEWIWVLWDRRPKR